MPTQEALDHLLGLARAAADRGDRVLHLQVEVATLAGQQSSWGSSGAGVVQDDTIGHFLSYVESLGWTLEHTGYSFVETGSSTSGKVFGTGEGRVNQGLVVGFFTFRRAAA
ncbi:hypothetical protein ABZ477_05785 [Microbacterium sp. NPDC019599]|uniref:hypothetical protein n=1 Tax=Microbacterium sp. NPDC019599 TaxID=3154690 RepID=UPI0033D8F5BD